MKRTISNRKYYLDLTKEVCVFTMMAYGFANETMMSSLGPMIVLLATLFMFIPRDYIMNFLGKDEGRKKKAVPEWQISNLWMVLDFMKFVSLIVLTLYAFLNSIMMDFGGTLLLWTVSCFMVVPRKLIKILYFEINKAQKQLYD